MENNNARLELLNSLNQKLLDNDKMFRMICGTFNSTFLYYDYADDRFETLGNYSHFFDFPIEKEADLYHMIDSFLPDEKKVLEKTLFPERADRTAVGCECRMSDGRWIGIEVTVSKNEAGVLSEKIIRLNDATREREQTESLKYMAYYDTLTGLYNRNYFVRLLSDWVRKAQTEKESIEVLCLMVDDFKNINDSLGMIAGDELLQNIGLFLRGKQSEDCLISHFHSNVYFAAFYGQPQDYGRLFFDELSRYLQDPISITDDEKIRITVSGGQSCYPESAHNSLELINFAEIVLEQQKRENPGRLYSFKAPVLDDFLQNIALEKELRAAIDEEAFELYYQPQYDSMTKRLRGVEALIRWRNKEGFFISPSKFIPLAERDGLIDKIGHWVLEEALRSYSDWQNSFHYPMVLSVNISAMQFRKNDFILSLFDLIRKYGINPVNLELEITESVLIDDLDSVLDQMHKIREMGIKISLDDFGTGYSSLSYLKNLPIDTLKIDKSFIDTVIEDSSTRIITESIISMVKKLGYETVAEGVENNRQYEYLQSIECDNIQGFLLGKPMPSGEIEELLAEMVS